MIAKIMKWAPKIAGRMISVVRITFRSHMHTGAAFRRRSDT
jgi:hypothetical protein